ncbi:hypothetical protein GCM10009780_30470 [Actinomadura alba]
MVDIPFVSAESPSLDQMPRPEGRSHASEACNTDRPSADGGRKKGSCAFASVWPVVGFHDIERIRESISHTRGGPAQLKSWKILTKLRCRPYRAGHLAKAIHVLQNHETTTL